MGIKTKFNPMGGILNKDKGKLSLWRYSNDVIAGKTLLYNYKGSWDIDTLYVPMVKGKSIINDWYNVSSSGTTDTERNTPFYNNPNVVNVDLQGVSFRNNSMYYAFNNCKNLIFVNNIPNSVGIMDGTFYNCINLNQNIQIPNSVIDMDATFYNCSNLNQNIQIPNSVTVMYRTFYFCHNLNSCINILSAEITSATGCFNVFNASCIPNVVIQSRYINNGATPTWNALNAAGWKIGLTAGGTIVGTSPNRIAGWDWVYSDWTYVGNGTHWVASKWKGELSAFFNENSPVVDLTIPDEICGYPIALSTDCFNYNSIINSLDCNHVRMIPSSEGIFRGMSNLEAVWNINLNGVTQAYTLTWNCQNVNSISTGTPQIGTAYLAFEDAVTNAQAQYGLCKNISNFYLLGEGITKCYATWNKCNTRPVNIYMNFTGFSNFTNWFMTYSASYRKNIHMYFQWSNGVNTPLFNGFRVNNLYKSTSGNSSADINPMYNSTSNFYIYNMSKDFCPTNNPSWMCCPVNGALRYTGDKYDDNVPITIPTSLSVAQYPDKNVIVTTNVQNFSNMFEGFFKMNCPITIPSGVVDMNYTFYNCRNLNQNIKIPNSVTSMSYSFAYCNMLNQNIQIPNLVTYMGGTFRGCYNLDQNIQIPQGIISLFDTFMSCWDLNQNIQIPNSVTDMINTFHSCYSLNQNIQIPSLVMDMSNTFAYCSSLNQNIQIPNSVTSMYNTFYSCSNLSGRISILTTELTNSYHTFWFTNASKPKEVYIYFNYANGVPTKTYNQVVANTNTNYKWQGQNGVTVYNLGRAPW